MIIVQAMIPVLSIFLRATKCVFAYVAIYNFLGMSGFEPKVLPQQAGALPTSHPALLT
jgi:hypothetical protein